MVQFNNIIGGGLVGKMGIFSVILWYANLQISSLQFTVLFVGLFVGYSIPQTFTVYQTLAISQLAVFFGKFLGFLGLNSILCQLEGQFQIDQDYLGSPVRISPSQFYIGICLFETVPD